MLSLLLLLELKISIDYYWGLVQRGWNQSCYVVGAKSVASGINTEATHRDTQTNLFPACLTPPWTNGDHGPPRALGPKVLGPSRTA